MCSQGEQLIAAGFPSELLFASGENQLVESCTRSNKTAMLPYFCGIFLSMGRASERAGVHAVFGAKQGIQAVHEREFPRTVQRGDAGEDMRGALLTTRVVGFGKHFCSAGDVSGFS